jgi:hypothetical protein
MKKITWSASRIKKFHQCKNEYNLNYNAGVRADWASPLTTKGSAFHFLAEHFLGNESLSFKDWEVKLREYESYGKKLDIDSINLSELEAAFENFKIFWQEFVITGQYKIHTEEKIEFLIDDMPMQGIVDLVLIKDNNYTILDYKTSKSGTGDHDLQLSVYVLAVHAKYAPDVPIKDFIKQVTIYIYYPYAQFKKHQLENLKQIKLQWSDVDSGKDTILNTIEAIGEEKNWVPTVTYACQFCIFQGTEFCLESAGKGYHRIRGLVFKQSGEVVTPSTYVH